MLSTVTRGGVLLAMGPAPAAGFAVGALVAWWGPGGDSLRRGTRSIVRGVVCPGLPTGIVAGALIGVMVVLGGEAFAHLGVPSWWPFEAVVPRGREAAAGR